MMEGYASAAASVHYFNAKAGYWEPAIEQFKLVCKLTQRGKTNTTSLTF